MESFIVSSSGLSYQIYVDYSKWTSDNENFYADNPAFQDLNNQNYMKSLTVDLTESEVKKADEVNQIDGSMEVARPESPTQARDFKLHCEGCKRSFTSKKRLQNHQIKCSKKLRREKIRAFSCRECRKTFTKRSGLVNHCMKYHEEQLPIVNVESPKKRSIFHSIEMMAVSDCQR